MAVEIRAAKRVGPGSDATVTAVPPVATAAVPAPGVAEVVFSGDFDTGDFDQWPLVQNIEHNDPGATYDASGTHYCGSVTTSARSGSHAGRFEVRNGDIPFGGTERSEVATDVLATTGQTQWYSWSTKFDTVFPTNHASAGWGLVAQWHCESSTGSPPVGLYVDQVNGSFTVLINRQSSPGNFLSTEVLWSHTLDKGSWHDLVWQITWSTSDATGMVKLWHNGTPVTFTGGPGAGTTTTTTRTLIPTAGGVYFKQGYYRQSASIGTGIVYHDGFRAYT